MTDVVSPYDDADLWDSVKILVSRNGKSNLYAWKDLPVDFDGDIVNDYDVKKAKGADGAKKTDNGYQLTQCSMTWLLHKPEHFAAYMAFVKDAKPRAGKDPKPVIIIVHPLLQLYDLPWFNIEKLPFLECKGVDQWQAKMNLIEWMPEPKPVKPPAEKSGVITLPEITVTKSATIIKGKTYSERRDITSFSRNRDITSFQRGPALPSQNVKPSQ